VSKRYNDIIKKAQGNMEPTSNDLKIYYENYEDERDEGDGGCYGSKGHYQTIVPKSLIEINFERWESTIPQLMVRNDDNLSNAIVINKPNNNTIRYPESSPVVLMRQPLATKTQTARSPVPANIPSTA
jgi:hypothetical protein